MASEIQITTQLTATKGSLVVNRQATVVADMSGSHYTSKAAAIPTTAGGTALDLGSVATAGFVYVRNLDTTNYVTLGIQTGGTYYPFAKLKPGETSLFRLGTNAPYAQANTATAVLEYWIVED